MYRNLYLCLALLAVAPMHAQAADDVIKCNEKGGYLERLECRVQNLENKAYSARFTEPDKQLGQTCKENWSKCDSEVDVRCQKKGYQGGSPLQLTPDNGGVASVTFGCYGGTEIKN